MNFTLRQEGGKSHRKNNTRKLKLRLPFQGCDNILDCSRLSFNNFLKCSMMQMIQQVSQSSARRIHALWNLPSTERGALVCCIYRQETSTHTHFAFPVSGQGGSYQRRISHTKRQVPTIKYFFYKLNKFTFQLLTSTFWKPNQNK